jgi:hypothetical protein
MKLVANGLACLLLIGFAACGGDSTSVDAVDPGGSDVPVDSADPDVPGDPGPDTTLSDQGSDQAPDVDPSDAQIDAPDSNGFPYEPGDPLEPPTPLAPFFGAHPDAFARMSGFFTHVQGPVEGRPGLGHRGAFGTGNGHTFALIGQVDPLNTLHGLVGPTYERRPHFFGDYAVVLAQGDGGDVMAFEEEWAGQSLVAPVLVTAGRWGSVVMETADFVPNVQGLARNCFYRVLSLSNLGEQSSGNLEIRVVANNSVQIPESDVLVETQRARVLATRFVQAGGNAEGRVLSMEVGVIGPGESVVRTLVHCTADGLEPPATPADDVGDLLDATAAAYSAWEENLVQIDVPEQWVGDFLDGMKMTLKMQTSAFGATCPMSQYTRTWARDNIGPVMAMLALGAHDDVDAMLDYVYGAIRYGGDLSNSYDADLDPALAPPAPDWESLGPLGTRVAGETPSYMVIMYGLHSRYTGESSRAADRWGLLRRCMFAQGFGPDRLLPFTGDETFRAAMNATFGMNLEYEHHLLTWSLNSSALWMGAAREFIRLTEVLGKPDDFDEVLDVAMEVQEGVLNHYLDDDGCMLAFVHRDTLEPSGPFEDASLQLTWSGWLNGDHELAQNNIGCLMQRLRKAPGVLQSDMHENYIGFFPGGDDGVYTGMLPGYTLASLVDTGHPEAHDAYRAVRESLDTSGNLQEYMLFGDRSGLSIFYNPSGIGDVIDYTAKYRPWEGGIVAEAVFRYLVGLRPDAEEGTLALRPHLPAGWDNASYRNLRVAGDLFDLDLTRESDGISVKLSSRGSRDWQVRFRWDVPGDAVPMVTVNNVEISEGELERFDHFGVVSLGVPPHGLTPGGSLAFRFETGE